jgi:DMSO/TMAO reductase YedYZ molybdopterin-dependent catalytic subunit
VPPAADLATWRLRIGGEVPAPLALSLDELRGMPAARVTATLECAGNGRGNFEPSVAGVQWLRGAVGTARWTGVRLADVLRRSGARPSARFVWMSGADAPLGTMPDFVRQVPIAKAMHPDTILAYEMNGVALPQAHGAPLRAIVPGWEGAYSVKWLDALTVSASQSDSFWVATAYKYPIRRIAPGAAVEARDMAPVSGLPVKSLITRPLEGTTVRMGGATVAGFAWAGEHAIASVEVSTDAGATWRRARLVGEAAPFAWRRFELAVRFERAESYVLMSRAADRSGRVQPAVAQWNPSGYLWNQPDVVRVEVAA